MNQQIICFLIVTSLCGFEARAQKNTVSAGGDASGTAGTVNYSIGQIDYVTATGSGGSATQGVQQPYTVSIVTGIKEKDVSLEISAYPNPTADILKLKIGDIKKRPCSYRLETAEGKLIREENVTSDLSIIDMQALTNGVYYLSIITEEQSIIKVFKTIKQK